MQLFNKANLPSRDFSFWEWFSSLEKLVKTHFADMWSAGYIHGACNRIRVCTLALLPCVLSPRQSCVQHVLTFLSVSPLALMLRTHACAYALPFRMCSLPRLFLCMYARVCVCRAGFLDKQQVHTHLSTCQPGTFLLRFSESVKNGISVSWVGVDAAGNVVVNNLYVLACFLLCVCDVCVRGVLYSVLA